MNGNNWTEVNDLNAAFQNGGAAGTDTAAIAFGGLSPKAQTEDWNGVSWVEVNDLNTGRDNRPGGTGTTSAGLAFGGSDPSPAQTAATEEWNVPSNTVKTLTD